MLSLLDDKREYGKQRLWGQFGFGLAGCIVGPLLMNHKFGGYKAAFYVHALISLPTLFIMRRFDPTPRATASASSKAVQGNGKGKGKGQGKKGQVQPRFREGLGLVVRNPDNLIFFLMGTSVRRMHCMALHRMAWRGVQTHGPPATPYLTTYLATRLILPFHRLIFPPWLVHSCLQCL